MKYQKVPEWRLWAHALSPSMASIISSVVIVIFIMAFHLLLLSNNPDLVITELAVTNPDDRLTTFYAETIQGPIDEAFGNDALGMLSTAALWGFIGWVVYGLIEFFAGNFSKLHRSAREISAPLKSQIIKHPLRSQVLTRLLWRFFIGLLIALWTIAVQPYVIELFQRDLALLTADSALTTATHGIVIVGGWLVVFHVYCVLLRLFVMRTRFFGEIIY